MGDKEWRNGRRAPTQDPSTNNRRLCVGAALGRLRLSYRARRALQLHRLAPARALHAQLVLWRRRGGEAPLSSTAVAHPRPSQITRWQWRPTVVGREYLCCKLQISKILGPAGSCELAPVVMVQDPFLYYDAAGVLRQVDENGV